MVDAVAGQDGSLQPASDDQLVRRRAIDAVPRLVLVQSLKCGPLGCDWASRAACLAGARLRRETGGADPAPNTTPPACLSRFQPVGNPCSAVLDDTELFQDCRWMLLCIAGVSAQLHSVDGKISFSRRGSNGAPSGGANDVVRWSR